MALHDLRWTQTAVIAAIRGFSEATGRWPLAREFLSAHGLPSTRTVERLFGHLAAARRAAGMPGGGIVRRTAEERAQRAWEVSGEVVSGE